VSLTPLTPDEQLKLQQALDLQDAIYVAPKINEKMDSFRNLNPNGTPPIQTWVHEILEEKDKNVGPFRNN
jgi:hypothetical protein